MALPEKREGCIKFIEKGGFNFQPEVLKYQRLSKFQYTFKYLSLFKCVYQYLSIKIKIYELLTKPISTPIYFLVNHGHTVKKLKHDYLTEKISVRLQ